MKERKIKNFVEKRQKLVNFLNKNSPKSPKFLRRHLSAPPQLQLSKGQRLCPQGCIPYRIPCTVYRQLPCFRPYRIPHTVYRILGIPHGFTPLRMAFSGEKYTPKNSIFRGKIHLKMVKFPVKIATFLTKRATASCPTMINIYNN